MMRSLYSGVSGLKVHQTKMDVIGNNIANVNTVGFKSSTVTFSDILYQTSSSASGPNSDSGKTGINAKQIGLGSSLSSITTQMTVSGGSQRTDNPFDIMIEGDSFFIVNDGSGNCFTKAGAFTVDASGTMCTATGHALMGWQVDPNDPTKCVADRVSALRIMSPENMYVEPEATKDVYITGNIDSKDTQIASDTGKTVSVSFYDSLGQSYMLTLRVTQSEESTTKYNVSPINIFDGAGKSIFSNTVVADDGTTTYEATGIESFTIGEYTYTAEVDTDTGTITFDSDDANILTFDGATGTYIGIGEDDSTSDSIAFSITTQPNPFSEINIDFSTLTMYANSGTSNLESVKGSVAGLNAGKQAGNMTGVSVDASGMIYGVYDNGDTKLLGQIAVTTFANASGLEAIGNNLYATTMNSGEFDGVGESVDQSGGAFTTGVLEMSNVDLASQFTDMITTQRGFQANSRIITTSDTLLEELINLKR